MIAVFQVVDLLKKKRDMTSNEVSHLIFISLFSHPRRFYLVQIFASLFVVSMNDVWIWVVCDAYNYALLMV